MTVKDIKEIIKLIDEYKLAEFKLEDGSLKMTIRSNSYSKEGISVIAPQEMMAVPVAQPAIAVQAPTTVSQADPAGASEAHLVEVKSPIVGTFYRSSGPDKPPFVKVGDALNVGDVVCVVEAMKLFNEIESEVSGKIVKVLVEDASPVEYDQVLFLVDPKA